MIVSESAHPRYPWRVKWKEGVKGRNRFFLTEKAARAFARRKGGEIRDIAPSDDPPTKEERHAIAEARARSVPLMEAIQHWRRTVGASAGKSFAEFIEARRAAAKKDDISPHYRRALGRLLDLAKENLGRTMAVGITPGDCQAFIERWTGHDAQKQARAALSGIFTHAMRMGWTQYNPAARLKLARRRKTAGVDILTVDEAAEWLCCVASRAPSCLAGWAIALFAGLRRTEVERLTWEEVKLDRGHVEVTAGKSKTRTRRLVEILPNLAAILEPLAKKAGRVLPMSPKRSEARAAENYGRPLPRNVARHSFVSYHLAMFNDLSLTEIQAGHDREVLFRHYRELVTPADAGAYFSITL